MHNQKIIGAALLPSVAIVIGVYISGALGITEAPTTSSYLIGAAAGFVGGWVGAALRERRQRT